MSIAYIDSPSGAGGDMILAALIDAGLDAPELERRLASLPIEPFRIVAEKRIRSGIGATGVRIEIEGEPQERGFSRIAAAIDEADLPEGVRAKAIGVFRLLGEAEAAVHRIPLEKVHFHEVGAVDAIVDIVGVVAGLDLLGVEEVYAAVPPTGRGTVRCAHGVIPLPAPATLEILRGRAHRPTDVEGELLTPTGAALLVGLTERFGPPPAFLLESIGYGAGTTERDGLPNILRLSLGRREGASRAERIVLLETDVDDVPSEGIGHLFERAIDAGALDVTVAPVAMKKNRPGHRITVVARPADRERLAALVMEETGTLGVRAHEVDRIALGREVVEVGTRYGSLRFKRTRLPGGRRRLTPEYDDCAAVARERGLPFLEVWEGALRDGEEKV